MSGFEFGSELSFGFGSAVVLSHICIGKSEGGRVVFLLGRLILLIGFFASAVKKFTVAHVEVTGVFTVGFATNLFESGCCYYLSHTICEIKKYIIYKYII